MFMVVHWPMESARLTDLLRHGGKNAADIPFNPQYAKHCVSRILFLIEGLPTCVFSLIPFFFLPDSIAQATFLNEREKQIAYHFVARNQRLDVDKNQGIRFKEVLEGLLDPKSFLPGLMYFGW